MNNFRGGAKTSIFLFSLLVFISFLLFLFVQNIYLESKNTATSGLFNANNCLDLNFDIVDFENDESGFFNVNIINNPNSIQIDKINLGNKGEIETINVTINPGRTVKITSSKNITGTTEIYPNNCKNYAKLVNVK